MDKVIAVILAGGKSSRMGVDKSSLPAYGKTMLSHLVSVYKEAFERVYVSGRDCEGTERLYDEYQGVGPMAGLSSAFTATDAEAVFITATDMPNGSSELAAKLVDLSEGYDACIIRRRDGFVEPTFAVYKRACLPVIISGIESGRFSLMYVLDRVNVRYVEDNELSGFDLDKILANVNTPEEYKRFLGESDNQSDK